MPKQRETSQKQEIELAISKMPSFFTAADLHKKIQKKNPKIGIATIYRFLKDLKKKRSIHSYNCEKKTLYSTSEKNHCHFICETCKKVEHISIKDLGFLKPELKERTCHLQIDIYGKCESCSKKS